MLATPKLRWRIYTYWGKLCDMGLVPITLMGYRCERCGYEWVPRSTTEVPRVCSRCKSPYWNRPRQKRAEAPCEEGHTQEAQENA